MSRRRNHKNTPAVKLKSAKGHSRGKPVFCLVVPWMALGGADKCGLDLMAHYKSRGFRISVISTREMTRRDSRREKEFLSLADDVFYNENVVEIVKKLQPVYTVVNNSHEAYDQAGAIKEAAPNTKLVSLFHMILSSPWDFEKSLQRGTPFDLVLTVSDKLKGELVEKGVNKDMVETLHWFGFPEIKKTWPLRNTEKDPRYVLCPFRFHFQKRPAFVCDIAAELAMLLPAAYMPVFKFVGDGELYSKIKERANELKVSHWIEFERGVDYKQMEKFYKRASALVCPSIDEGIPLTYFEAMQWSVPMAVSNVGAVNELVPSNYMIDFEMEDEAKEYAKLLFLHLTGQSRAEIHAARKLVNENFSKSVWDEKVKRLIG
jgi:glycosyltransferase involved in cell wall biosynthesis